MARRTHNEPESQPQPTADPVQLKRLELLVEEIEHYSGLVAKLQQEDAELNNKIWWCEKKGLLCSGLKERQEKLQQKLWSARHKLSKAELNKMLIERKLQNNG